MPVSFKSRQLLWPLVILLVVIIVTVSKYFEPHASLAEHVVVTLLSSGKPIEMGHGAHTVVKTFSSGGKTFKMRLIFFDTEHHDLRVVDQPSRMQPKPLAAACTELHAIAGCNGGYFSLNFAPHGLMIADGVRYDADIVKSMGGQGGAIVVRGGKARLIDDKTYKDGKDVTQFLQCCPLFIVDGQPLPDMSGGQRRHRTFVLTDNRDHWAIGSTESVSLQELFDAVRLKGVITEFEVKMALNLDGGRSHGLWWKNAAGKPHDVPTSGPVRNYLVVVPQAVP